MSMINYELYKVFYLAAKTGSLTQAARMLYLTQPSVSHAIKQLESSLGATLFARNAKGVELTHEGAILYAYIEQAHTFITLAEDKMAELNNLESGELRIGGSDSLFKHYLLSYLEAYRLAHPGIAIRLIHGTTPELIASLKEGAIDLGVVRLPISDTQLEINRGIELQDCFVAGSQFSELKGQMLSMEQLLDYPIILFSRNSRARTAITELFREHGHELTPQIEVGSVDLLLEFARKGLGISFVTREFAARHLEDGTLFEINLDVKVPPSQVGFMTLRNMPLSKAAQRFLSQIG